MPADQGQNGSCVIHALVGDIEADFNEKHDIIIDYSGAVSCLMNRCEAYDGSNPLDVIAVINKDKTLRIWHHQQVTGSPEVYRIRVENAKKIFDFSRLYSIMGSRKVPQRALVVVNNKSGAEEEEEERRRRTIMPSQLEGDMKTTEAKKDGYMRAIRGEALNRHCTLIPRPTGTTSSLK